METQVSGTPDIDERGEVDCWREEGGGDWGEGAIINMDWRGRARWETIWTLLSQKILGISNETWVSTNEFLSFMLTIMANQ